MTPTTAQAPRLLLEARKVEGGAGDRVLFRNLDLAVHEGELVAVTGPNGIGKSTLLRILLGAARPGAGEVSRARGLRVGFMPQLDPADPGLPFPAISIVKQGLRALAVTPRGIRAADRRARAALARVGFRAPPSRRYSHLSGGERRRVLLARALVGDPALLVLDEPTAGVDKEGTRETLGIVLSQVRGERLAALWVCHGLPAVEEAATRVVRMDGVS